jgi:chromosome segregation ATPase
MEREAKMLVDTLHNVESKFEIEAKTCESLRDDMDCRDSEIARLRDYYKAQNEALSRENNELQDGKREVALRLEGVNGEYAALNEQLSREKGELQASFDSLSADYKELENDRFMRDEKENDYVAQNDILLNEKSQLQASFDALNAEYKELENDRCMKDKREKDYVSQHELLLKEKSELQVSLNAANADYKEMEHAQFLKEERENDARESAERETDKMFFELSDVKGDLVRVQAEKDVLGVCACINLIK